MSKFLKFIVNLFLVLAIVVTAGIIIPPLLGVNTTIVDTAGMDTNLPLGSVTYSRDKAVLDLKEGDEILKESGSATYAYIIQEGDATTGEFTAVSATEPEASPEKIVIRNNVSEVVLTVPYIGFVVVAMQSLEGRIIIALVILFIIILFILSELWKKRDDDEEDDDTSGGWGNVQPASADAADDAGNGLRKLDESTRYSENIKDKRGYGTMSQDTASIAAAMAELSVLNTQPDAKKKAAAEADSESLDSEAQDVASLSSEQEPVEENSEADPASDTEAVYESAVGDTKVFPDSLASQMRDSVAEEITSIAAETFSEIAETSSETADQVVTGSKDDMADALIAETEKAAAAWVESPKEDLKGEAGEEPKLLWSWTDEPFENEIDDSWSGLQKGQRTDSDDIPERFAPVERMTRQEILEQARSGGSDPKVIRDDVTGIDIIDYSDLL